MKWFNRIEAYINAGTMAGRASKRHDAGLCSHWSDWTRKAIALELPEVKPLARQAFDQAYREEAMPEVRL